MTSDDNPHSKAQVLRDEGTWNASYEHVNDPKFRAGEFFDPRDLVQVKYEMLRRVRVEHIPVAHAAEQYGLSRPTYYQACVNFDQAGIAGLVPKKRGPRRRHKLTEEVLTYLEQQRVAGRPLRARELAAQVRQRFDLEVHPRTIERALTGKKTPG